MPYKWGEFTTYHLEKLIYVTRFSTAPICDIWGVLKFYWLSKTMLNLYSGSPMCDGNHVRAFCCPNSVDASSCVWKGQQNWQNICKWNSCASNEVQVGLDPNGGGRTCPTVAIGPRGGAPLKFDANMALCCSATALNIVSQYPTNTSSLS